MVKNILLVLLLFSPVFGQVIWFEGNLKGIDELSLEVVIEYNDNTTLKNKLNHNALLHLKKNNINVNKKIFSPTLLILVDLVSIDKNKIRLYNIDLRLIDLFVSKEKYLKNKSQKNVISKFSKGIIYQDNILGQSSSEELSMNIEETLDQLLKSFSKSWYKDNPTKLF
jgi:hypothetical protein